MQLYKFLIITHACLDLGDFGCYTSCEFQNCATGHCTS